VQFPWLQIQYSPPQSSLRNCLCGVCAIFSLVVLPGSVFSQTVYLSPHIYHTPVLQAYAGANLDIQVTTEEGAGQISSASLLWRIPGGEFRSADLEPVPGGLGYTISAEEVNPPTIEYAILIRLASGQQVTFPLRDPFMSPQVINVIAPPRPARPAPQFVVLYPKEGDVVSDSEVRIAVSVFDPDSVFDPGSLEVYMDGKRAQPRQASANYVLLVVLGPRPGRHEVVLRSRAFTGQYNPDYSWSFQTLGKGEKQPVATFAWSFTGEARQEDFGGQEEGILRGDWHAEGDIGAMKYGARCYLTSEEAWDLQPQDRFLLSLRSRRLSLELGDATPVFSDLILFGKRVRGIELGLHGASTHLLAVFGEDYRAIEGSTYRRFLGGFRPYLTTSSGARFGLSFLKVKDDVGSVAEASASPQDNIVAGLDAFVPLFQQKLQWSFSAALSLTAMDIRGGTVSDLALKDAGVDVPFDPEPLEPIIVINESLSPPNPLSLSSLAWTTAVNLNHFGQIFSLNYRRIGPAYYSLGNPYLQNDLSGWGLSDQLSLWRNRAFVNFGLNRLQDNLKENKPTTTTTTGGWVSLALYPPAPAPQIVLTFNASRGANDLKSIDTLLIETGEGSDTVYSDLRRDDVCRTFSAALSQGIFLLQRRHVLTLNANLSEYEDGLAQRPPGYPDLNSSARNFGLAWRTYFSPLRIATIEYAYYSSSTAALSYKYHQFGASFLGRFFNRKLSVSGGGYRRSGDDDLSRWQGDLTAEWEFYPKHALRAAANHYFNDSIPDEAIYRLYYFKRF